MEVYYGNKLVNQNFLTPFETSTQPVVSYPTEKDSYYTLFLYDPDAVTESGYYIHWAVTNIPGNRIEDGNVILSYSGPNPPKKSGIHRYIFSVYKQRNKFFPFYIPKRTDYFHIVMNYLNLAVQSPVYSVYFLSHHI
jgi:hypothetical protein